MTKSPIKLKSSSKAKLRATKSPSNHNEESQLLADQSKLRSSVHTIPVKQSPRGHRNLKSNFTTEAINYAKSQPYNNVTFRSGSPVTIRDSPKRNLQFSQQLSETKSFHEMISSHPPPSRQLLVSPQKSVLYDSIVRQNSLLNIMSPIKSGLDNDRSFIKVQLGKKVSHNQSMSSGPQVISSNQMKFPSKEIITVRPIMVSPQKVIHSVQKNQPVQPQFVQQVHCQVSGRQIELQRKVKILEMRIGELYAQKNQMETQMNETNIRLQYQNNFLKEKLDTFTSIQRQSFSHQQKQSPQSNQKSSTLSQQASERLIKQLEKSQENEYHQSKEIHNLRQQLLQTEEMLSKQISKSLSLLEELTDKEKENEDLKKDFKKLKEKLLNAEKSFTQSQNHSEELQNTQYLLTDLNTRLEEAECQKINFSLQVRQLQASLEETQHQNNSLIKELEGMREKDNETRVTRDLMNELEQNNQLLISAIRSLEGSLRESETQVQLFQDQKSQLQQKLYQLEDEIGRNYNARQQNEQNYERQVQNLGQKLLQIETELIEKNILVEDLSMAIKEQQNKLKEQCEKLQESGFLIKRQQSKIEQLMKCQEEGNLSTANSFYKKLSDPCGKCDEMRKTIIKLNSHLTKSSSSISSTVKC